MAEPTCRLTASTCRLAASRRTNASPGRAALHTAWPRQQPAASQRGAKNTPNQARLGPPNRALLQQPIRGYGTGAPKTFSDNVTPVRNAGMGRENDGRASSNLPPRRVSLPRPCGVTVSTLDFESSDRGSNPREALACTRGSSGLLWHASLRARCLILIRRGEAREDCLFIAHC